MYTARFQGDPQHHSTKSSGHSVIPLNAFVLDRETRLRATLGQAVPHFCPSWIGVQAAVAPLEVRDI